MTACRPPLRPLCLALLLLCLPPAWAQGSDTPPATPDDRAKTARPADAPADKTRLQRVEISGGPSGTAQRRASTAAKIIIGRDEIERFGDASIADVLKRLPGVTTGGRPGRGGDIRMSGMGGGYTQILVDGERMPPSFSLDQLPPEQIERIEVMRAPTAEYGARAVAGTINIVLREALLKRLNDLRLVLGSERGELQPQLSWTRNDKLDTDGGAYNLTLTANQSKRPNDVDTRITTRDLSSGSASVQRDTGHSDNERKSLNLNGRLQWRLGGGDMLTVMPFLMLAKGQGESEYRQDPPGSFSQVGTRSGSDFHMLRLNTLLNKRLGEDTRLELRGNLGRAAMDNEARRQESMNSGAGWLPTRLQQDWTENRDKTWSLAGKLSRQLASEHSLVGGLEAEGSRRTQDRRTLEDGMRLQALEDFGDEFKVSTLRLAGYLQDEWAPSKQWSAYAGLRWEGLRTESQGLHYAAQSSSSVWTPLLHAVWKPDEKSRDQLRMSLTRSYRSPGTQDLIARPAINAQYPSGANTANYPDRAGNPALRPEMATGIDLAFERYLSKGGMLSVSLFARRIKHLMRSVTSLENVPWSSAPRWVARPGNLGKALTQGVELEAKFRLDEFVDAAPPVFLRGNLSLFHSRVDTLPGPHNKLDQQPRGTLNLGADYRLRSLPLSLGGNLNYVPANTVQQSLLQQSSNARKRVIDAFALWNLSRDVALRLSASNLAPLDYDSGNLITTSQDVITTENLGRTFTQWQLRLEMKL